MVVMIGMAIVGYYPYHDYIYIHLIITLKKTVIGWGQ